MIDKSKIENVKIYMTYKIKIMTTLKSKRYYKGKFIKIRQIKIMTY